MTFNWLCYGNKNFQKFLKKNVVRKQKRRIFAPFKTKLVP